MIEIKLKINSNNRGSFFVEENEETVAEMNIGIDNGKLIVYHTEVSEKLKGQNIGKQLIEKMVAYARENNLKVVPLCPFVNAQFKRHKDLYADLIEQS